MVNLNRRWPSICYIGAGLVFSLCCILPNPVMGTQQKLRFGAEGEFKILQVADMHYGTGSNTGCLDVLPTQKPCSDLNTTAFLDRMIRAEKPHLIVFTGDNIYGHDTEEPTISMDAAFRPAITSGIPWVAILGNHDQESSLSREEVMKYIVGLKNTLSQVNPLEAKRIDGFGNNNLEIGGVKGSKFQDKSVLNLYFLDSGDYPSFPLIPGYDWIKGSQQNWFKKTSEKLQKAYMSDPEAQQGPAPGLVYFHIPLPEFRKIDASSYIGQKQEVVGAPIWNSGFFKTISNSGDVRAVFVGHDHVNDFCGNMGGIELCYAGGFGYHAYGKAGWSRRARVVVASLEKTNEGDWGAVESIKTWKRLDDEQLTTIDSQILWSKSSAVSSLPSNPS